LKWLGTGVMAGVVAGGLSYGVRAVAERASVRTTVGVRTEARGAAEKGSRAAFGSPPEPRPNVEVRPPPVASFEIPEVAAKKAPPSPTSSAPSARAGLAEETEAINRIQSALTAGDARAALKRIDDYERAYPGGLLSVEAEVLRIEALSAFGSRGELGWRARRFLEAYPGSPYAGRVRSLLEGTTGTAP